MRSIKLVTLMVALGMNIASSNEMFEEGDRTGWALYVERGPRR